MCTIHRMDTIDVILYINLKHRVDRDAHFLVEIQNLHQIYQGCIVLTQFMEKGMLDVCKVI